MSNPTKLELPERELTNIVSNKRRYSADNVVNEFPFTHDGESLTGYFKFQRARLIEVRGRVQPTRSGNAIVITQNIIVDEPEIGLVGENDLLEPHEMFTADRYEAWRNPNRPKRINAQQWVQSDNRELVMDYVNYLHKSHKFSIIKNPMNPEGSQRKTQDLFVARPVAGRVITEQERANFGAKLDEFEVSLNPDYEQGFSSFVEGIEEQRNRWEEAYSVEDPKQRQQILDNISQNIHFLGGIYRDEATKSWWARPVDVGLVVITDPESGEQNEWSLYHQRGTELDESIFSELDGTRDEVKQVIPTGGVSVEKLALADVDEEAF